MKRVLSVVMVAFILVLSFAFVPFKTGVTIDAIAFDTTIYPTSRDNMVRDIDAFLQKNIDERNTSPFELSIEGSYIKNYTSENDAISPFESYFELVEPLNNYRKRAGNDYNAICFDTSPNVEALYFEYWAVWDPNNNNSLTKLKFRYEFKYGESASEKAYVEKFCQDTVDSITNSGITDPYQKIKALHDFVVNWGTTEGTEDNPSDYAYPYQYVTTKKGVCQAYAGLYWMLLKKAGFNCRIVMKGVGKDENGNDGNATAKGIAHAWNMVELGGRWYHVDPTWDDPQSSRPILSYDYFLKSTADMQRKYHIWDTSAYPVADVNYSANLPATSMAPSSKKTTTTNNTSATPSVAVSSEAVSSQSLTTSTVSSEESLSSAEITVSTIPKTNLLVVLFDVKKPTGILAVVGLIVIFLFGGGAIFFIIRRIK